MSAKIIPVQWYPRTWAPNAELGDIFETADEAGNMALCVRATDVMVVLVWVDDPKEIIPLAKRVLKPNAAPPPEPPTGPKAVG